MKIRDIQHRKASRPGSSVERRLAARGFARCRLLQEDQSPSTAAFPREICEDLGYAVETHGQKGFNGVGDLCPQTAAEDVSRRPDPAMDAENRRAGSRRP